MSDSKSSEPGKVTILIVEDDSSLREIMSRQAASLGYAVLQSGDGEEALAMIRTNPSVSLILSDVVLPGDLNGGDLAAKAAALRPDLPTVLMSGHSQMAILRQGGLDKDVAVLQKPFRRADLARVLAEALNTG